MIKILWADNQVHIAETFSHLLSSLKPNVTLVRSGEEALMALKQGNFDILILDLMMPPDKWGGLWTLEQLSKKRIRIPTLVLSGEGAQTETVAALRLGADDYVLKTNVEKELLEQVTALLDRHARDVADTAPSELPTVLAVPYQRYLSSTSPTSRLKRLIEFYEFGLKLCGILGSCELGSFPEKHIPNHLATALLQGPSMGNWHQLDQFFQKELSRESGFLHIYSCFDNHVSSSIVKLRNDISHGIEPSIKGAETELNKWSIEISRLVLRLLQNQNIEFILPLNLNYLGDKFLINGHKLAGCSLSLPRFSAECSAPIICGHPYVIIKKMPANVFLDLHPLIIVETTVAPEVWRILLFDGAVGIQNMQKITGDESVRYIDIWSGERNATPSTIVTSKLLPKSFSDLCNS